MDKSPAENIAYGLLQYIQLNDENMYELLSAGIQTLKSNSNFNSILMYYTVFSDILSTQQMESSNISLILYRIKAYAAQFIKIVDFIDSHVSSKEYTLQDIKNLNTYITIVLKERFKLFGETKNDRKYVNNLLDYICNGNSDLRHILFKCIAEEYVEM